MIKERCEFCGTRPTQMMREVPGSGMVACDSCRQKAVPIAVYDESGAIIEILWRVPRVTPRKETVRFRGIAYPLHRDESVNFIRQSEGYGKKAHAT
jgi:hypothetical protein